MGLLNIFKKKANNVPKEQPGYVVFDLETTGFGSDAEIIEIGAVRFVDDQAIDRFSTFVKPKCPITGMATKVNGITNEMVRNAPDIKAVMPQFLSFVGNSPLMGYNISTFDLPLIRKAASLIDKALNNPATDVLKIAREKCSFLPDCKLTTVASYFLIDTSSAHRAIDDCLITNRVFLKLKEIESPKASKPKQEKKFRPHFSEQTKAFRELDGILTGVMADNVLAEKEVMFLSDWIDRHDDLRGQFPYDRIADVINDALADGILEDHELKEMQRLFDEFVDPLKNSDSVDDCAFCDKAVVLTGNFSYGDKDVVETLLKDNGAIVKPSVTSKTDYVIVGELGSSHWSHGNYGSKIKKALELKETGGKVKIITEHDFLEAINNK